MPVRACVFDAYGTLFDVASAARAAAAEPGGAALAEVWPRLSADWRAKQLGYSWLRAAAGQHADFWRLTQDALDWAMEARGLTDPALRQRLLDLYWQLGAYPEVPEMLSALKAEGFATAILSNGSPGMLKAAVDSAGIGDRLDDLLSVESVGVFKPHPSVYQLVPDRFGCAPAEVLFVSSNGWDAGFAAAFGFTTAWVNRAGEPVDRLPGRPAHILTDLNPIPDLARRL